MKILISGASGLVGTHLIPTLKAKGHEIHKLVRKAPKGADEIQWDAEKGFSDAEQAKLEGFDAVIHLAGDNVASENWSAEKKRKIRESRTVGTRVLVDALRKAENPPKILISASAIGFYGNREDESLTEESAKGTGFFPEVCDEWEKESQKAEDFGVRVVNPGFVATPLTAANDFTMPALMTPEAAAQATLAGFAGGGFEIDFPRRFTRAMKLVAMLPYRWYFPLVRRITGA